MWTRKATFPSGWCKNVAFHQAVPQDVSVRVGSTAERVRPSLCILECVQWQGRGWIMNVFSNIYSFLSHVIVRMCISAWSCTAAFLHVGVRNYISYAPWWFMDVQPESWKAGCLLRRHRDVGATHHRLAWDIKDRNKKSLQDDLKTWWLISVGSWLLFVRCCYTFVYLSVWFKQCCFYWSRIHSCS